MTDKRRPWRHLYNTKRWYRLRAIRLRDEPICRMCAGENRVVAGQVVDHIVPHKGDEILFYDYENTQSLCKPHHDSSKKKAENRGVQDIGCDESGFPRDKGHHWAE